MKTCPTTRFALAVLGAVLVTLVASAADEPLISAPLMAQTPSSEIALLVLTNGRVIRGLITPRPTGYDIELPSGRLFIDSNDVRFPARDLADAYAKMRRTAAELTPETHLQLARWCMANKLQEEARREVLDALHLDPNRGEARRLLQELVRQSEAAASATEVTPGTPFTLFALAAPEVNPVPVRSLGGFTRETARRFVSDVQPILSNKCASASCHGGDAHVFRVVQPRNGSTPYVAEQNLAAVMQQVNLEAPESSPILQNLEGAHGGTRVPLFRGRAGSVQIEALRNWVLTAASELSPREVTSENAGILPTAALPASSRDRAPQLSADVRALAGANAQLKDADELDRGFLNDAVTAGIHDDFDPMEFNRRYRESDPGRTAESRTASKPPSFRP